jgi:DNA invertase Pin-like site-specific DNA recombinase
VSGKNDFLGSRLQDAAVAASFLFESGRQNDRPMLAEALALCRVHRAALVVANVSRLSRSVAFLSKLLAADVEIRFVDLPKIEGPTGKFMLHQMASVAELEAGMISDRTKKALAAAKVRGVKLGGFRGRAGTAADLVKARAMRSQAADRLAADLTPIVGRLDPDGRMSLRALAAALNEEGYPSPGGSQWTAASVARLKVRIAA